MSSSRSFVATGPAARKTRPAVGYGEHVLRGERAGIATSARFEVSLRERDQIPAEVMDRMRAEAHAAGYSEGWAQGRREARQAVEALERQADEEMRLAIEEQAEHIEKALAAIGTAARKLEQRVVPTLGELEETIVATAFALAEAVLGRELAVASEPGADAITRALALAPVNRPVQVRLNPADLETVGAGPRELDGRTVTLIGDPSLRPGDAIADCDTTTVDARLAPALERAREVLGL